MWRKQVAEDYLSFGSGVSGEQESVLADSVVYQEEKDAW